MSLLWKTIVRTTNVNQWLVLCLLLQQIYPLALQLIYKKCNKIMSHRHLKKVTYTKSNTPYHYVMYMSLTRLGTYSIVFICHIYYVKANVININNYLLQSCHILWMYTTSGSNSRYLNKSENLKPATSRKKIPQQKFASYLVRFIFSRLHVDIPLHDLQSYHVF